MSKVIGRITGLAEQLHTIRREIAAKEEEHTRELASMKETRDAIQAELLGQLAKNKLSSIKVSDGTSFSRSTRPGLEITNELFALKWAIENRAVSINKTLAAQHLKKAEALPPGFKLVETEFISVRKPKEAQQ